LLAVFMGILIGESDWTIMAGIITVVIILSFAQFTVRNLVAICLALVTLDYWIAPTGFKLGPMEQIGIVAGFAWLLVCWRRSFNLGAPMNFRTLKSWHFFENVVFVSAAYAIGHFVYNKFDPYEELAFGWKGATKSYAQTFGAFVMIVVLARARLLYPITADRSKLVLIVFLMCLIVSVVIGISRAIIIGPEMDTGLSMEEKSDLHRLFFIPGLNAQENIYTLRQLGPAATLIGSCFFFCRPANLGPFLPLTITALGFVASLASAGRATVVFAAAFMIAAMLRSRQGALAFAIGGLFAILVALLMVIPNSYLKESPYSVQRSVSYFRPDLQTQATEGIQGSSDMRWNFFQFAWQHYTSGDARMIFFGRSVGQMDSVDFLSYLLNNETAQMEFSVRRLSTHNGLTDFLLGWGLIGYILNMAMCISCIIMLFSYQKRFIRSSHGGCWIFTAAMFLSFWLFYTHFGGGFVWPLGIVLVLVALSQTDGLRKTESAVKPAGIPVILPMEQMEELTPAQG